MSGFIGTRVAQLGILPVAVRIYLAMLLATSVFGQTAEPQLAFEAASVKLNTGGAPYSTYGTPDGLSQIVVRGYPLKIVIFMAYGVGASSFSGPDWLDSVKVDVVAKLPPSAISLAPQERARVTQIMLQNLLAERFKLKVHREEKLVPGYALVVAPGGPKMRRVELTQPMGATSRDSITAHSLPVAQIVASAGGALGMPVRDMTGLTGYYEFNLTWTREETLLAAADNTSPASADRPPSIFTALQEQVGLKLEPRQIPLQIVVVDHVEKVPTDN